METWLHTGACKADKQTWERIGGVGFGRKIGSYAGRQVEGGGDGV